MIFVPHVIWQIQNGWPTLEFMSNARTMKMVALNPAAFFAEIALEAHPISLLLWLPGLIWLFLQRRLRPLAYIWPAAAVILLIGGGKPYYLAPADPLILCAGAVAVTVFLQRRTWRWDLPTLTTLLILGGLFTLPLALPLFSPEQTALYLTTTKLQPETGERSHRGQALPQYFADRFAWPEQAAAVAAAYATLDSTEREDCVVICANYGRAGSIDYFRRRGMDLPPPVCGHNSYFYWWPTDRSGATAISIGQSEEELSTAFESVERFATLDVPFAMSYEGHVDIWICRKAIVTLEQIRESLRFFI